MSEPKANISRERLRQLRKNAKGQCARSKCERPWSKGGLCATHYRETKGKAKERALASYYRRRDAAK